MKLLFFGLLLTSSIAISADNFANFGRGVRLGPITADPSNPKSGDLYYNSTSNLMKFYNGTTWGNVGGSSGADTALSNLAATAINVNLLPDLTANLRTLGSTTKVWFEEYVVQPKYAGTAFWYADSTYALTPGMIAANLSSTSPGGVSHTNQFVISNNNASPGPTMFLNSQNNATADANKTGDIRIETGNKTAGTGNSGSLYLYTGTSSGGTRGSITLESGGKVTVAAAALIFDQFYNGVIKTFDDTASANMTLKSGNSSAGASGTLLLTTGAPTTNSGGVVLSSANTSGGNSGTVQIKTGTASGTRGNITMDSTKVTSTGPIVLPNFTVAGLPSASTSGSGATALVTDALAPAFGVAVVGGGAVKIPVFSDGTNWIVF